jgi:GNAT superfamily N-acetyltransferase
VIRELAPEETALAFEAMRALRPHFGDEDAFVMRVNQVQRPEGYRIVAAFDPPEKRASAVAGFRSGHNLAWGSFLYVDDLSTLPDARRRGHGAALMQWLLDEARRLGCDSFHLDSGVGAERTDAHRLYFNQGLVITSHHFAAQLRGVGGPGAAPKIDTSS